MTVIQIVECSDEVIAKIPNIMGLLFEIYGKSEMKLFAIQNDDKLGFLAKVDNNCTYLDSNHNPIYFSLGVNEEIECIYYKGFTEEEIDQCEKYLQRILHNVEEQL